MENHEKTKKLERDGKCMKKHVNGTENASKSMEKAWENVKKARKRYRKCS